MWDGNNFSFSLNNPHNLLKNKWGCLRGMMIQYSFETASFYGGLNMNNE